MADLKKKFIDILFEDDVDEEELQDSSYLATKNGGQSIDAKDILYRKNDSSPFINIEEKLDSNSEQESEDVDEYEMSSQISPIFGLLKESKRKSAEFDSEVIETQTNKPNDSHLDIITSPIYGYSNKEDASDNNYEVKDILNENEEEELHHLFDEEEKLNFSYSNQDLDDDTSSDDISLFRLFGENK